MLCLSHSVLPLHVSMAPRTHNQLNKKDADMVYPVDLEVWSKLPQRARIKCIASKFARDFDFDWQRVNAFSHSVTLTCRLYLSKR